MRHPPQFRALNEELDAALASLQQARRLLANMMSSADAEAAEGVSGEPPSPRGGASSSSLRYSGMTVAQAAAVLGVGEEQVRRLLRKGALEGVSFRGKAGWRLDPDYVQEVAARWSALRAAQEALRARQSSAKRRKPGTKGKR